MGGGHEEVLREVVLLRARAAGSYPTPPLSAVLVQAGALDVALVADGNHHRLVGNHVLHREVAARVVDARAALVAVALAHLQQLTLNEGPLLQRRGQDGVQTVHQAHQLLVLSHQLVTLQAREALQAHV